MNCNLQKLFESVECLLINATVLNPEVPVPVLKLVLF